MAPRTISRLSRVLLASEPRIPRNMDESIPWNLAITTVRIAGGGRAGGPSAHLPLKAVIMENLGESQSLDDVSGEYITLGELIDSEASTSDAPMHADSTRRDLKTLRELGYKYCNRCEQVVHPKIVSHSRRSGFFFFPWDSERPLLRLIISLGRTSPTQSKKTWGCPFCSRDYRRLKRVQKKHLVPLEERPKGIPRRYLILMVSVPLIVCYMYALLARSERGWPVRRTPSVPSIAIPDETQPPVEGRNPVIERDLPSGLGEHVQEAPSRVPARDGRRPEDRGRPPSMVSSLCHRAQSTASDEFEAFPQRPP